MRYFSLFVCYTKTNLRRLMAYKVDFMFNLLAVIVWIVAGLVNLAILFSSTKSLAGWAFPEVCFLYGMWSLTFAIYNTFGAGILDLEEYIVSGKMDCILLKPVHPLFQITTLRINTMGIGFLLIGIVCILVSGVAVDISWSVGLFLYLLLAVLSGSVLVFSSFLFLSTLSFWLLKANSLVKVGYDIHKFSQYPISIYNNGIQFLLITLFPYAFSNYFPVAYILGKTSAVYGVLSILVCILMFFIALWFWNISLKKYEGCGS